MTKLLGSILAGLIVLQGALPSIGLEGIAANAVPVAVAVAVAAISFYLRPEPTP